MGRPKKHVKSANTNTAKKTHYVIANHNMGNIMFPPEMKNYARQVQPLVFPAGQAIKVTADVWEPLRAQKCVQDYIDAGILEEVKQEGQVLVNDRTTNPEIPAMLRTPEEEGVVGESGVTANLRRSDLITAGSI
jgi:hypothetical protein